MADNTAEKKSNSPEPGPEFAGFVAASVIAFLLAVVFAFSCPATDAKDKFVLDSKINPNTASIGQLVQLPKIGPKKAQTIIEYRGRYQSKSAFENIEDLQKVKGIGPKTAEEIQEWLVFE